MEISWEVEDGYAGGSAPQSFRIDNDEILECESVDAAMKMIEEVTQEDFNQKVSWHFLGYESLRSEVEKLLSEKKHA